MDIREAMNASFVCPNCGHNKFKAVRTRRRKGDEEGTIRYTRLCKGEGCSFSWIEEQDDQYLNVAS